jgi:hypothetical protein
MRVFKLGFYLSNITPTLHKKKQADYTDSTDRTKIGAQYKNTVLAMVRNFI